MCLPVITCETRICRKDSQYQTLLLGPVMGRGSIKSCQSNKNTSFGKKSVGVLREKSLKYQSMILNDLFVSSLLGFEANALYHAQIFFYSISASSKIASAYYAIGSGLKYHSLLIGKVDFSTPRNL